MIDFIKRIFRIGSAPTPVAAPWPFSDNAPATPAEPAVSAADTAKPAKKAPAKKAPAKKASKRVKKSD